MTDKKLHRLVLAALFTALTTVMTMVIQVPSPMQGYVNLGDCGVLLSAWVLGPAWGGAAAGIGSMLADLLSGTLDQLMREELDYRRITLRPKLLEAVKEARAFGDLSENFEYKAAKQEKNRNESRIRFLENMIKTAVVISDHSGADQVGLYDRVTVYMEDDDETEVYQIVTTMRQDVLKGLISKESPVGAALMGHRVGDRVKVEVNEDYSYYIVIREIEKGSDDESLPIRGY